MRTSILLLSLILLLLSCQQVDKIKEDKSLSDSTPTVQSVTSNQKEKDTHPTKVNPKRVELELGVGVIINNPEHDIYITKDTIVIYNDDQSVFATITPFNYKLEIEGKSYSYHEKKDTFSPRVFEPDYNLISFYCLGINEKGYRVLINDTTEKILLKSDLFKFEPWHVHLLKGYIEFDSSTNPIRIRPDDTSPLLDKEYSNYTFIAERVKGDWLKIRCKSGCPDCDEKLFFGWIKWKNGENIIIRVLYTC
jgi:hypothetical protein